MNVWVIKAGEPLPIDGACYRPHRIGMLADALLERGHSVTWWASTFNHQSKQQRFHLDTDVQVRDRYRVKLLHSMAYKSNVSLRRLLDHAQLGRRFARAIMSEANPDVIYCCYPTIELACAAVKYGRERSIPVLLDVRDLWPDNFVSVIPAAVRPLAQRAMHSYVGQARRAFAGCSAVIGISDGYLDFGLNYAGRKKSDLDAVYQLGYQCPAIDPNSLNEARAFLIEKGVDPGRTICWFVGMFGKTYDLNTVIDAASRFSRQGVDDVQFVLSGSGETEMELRTRAKGLQNLVFTGRINTPQVAAMSQLASIGLMAYTAGAPQGLPNKLYEYMSAGLPIVSSLQGETEALLNEVQAGLTCIAGDSVSLSETIETLRTNPLGSRAMGENGRRAFHERFSAGTLYVKLAEHLERIANSEATISQFAVAARRAESNIRAA